MDAEFLFVRYKILFFPIGCLSQSPLTLYNKRSVKSSNSFTFS